MRTLWYVRFLLAALARTQPPWAALSRPLPGVSLNAHRRYGRHVHVRQLKLGEIMTALFKGVIEDQREGSHEYAFSQQTQILCYNALSIAVFLSDAIGGSRPWRRGVRGGSVRGRSPVPREPVPQPRKRASS